MAVPQAKTPGANRGGFYGGLIGTVAGGLAWAVPTAFVIGRPLLAAIPIGVLALLLAAGAGLRSGEPRRDLRLLSAIFTAVALADVAFVLAWWERIPETYSRGMSGGAVVAGIAVMWGALTLQLTCAARR